jgi:hypothetical protein
MSELERLSKKAADEHERRRAMLYLEAAIGAMLECMSLTEVKRILRAHAIHLDEFG